MSETMNFTKEQTESVLRKFSNQENGLNEVLEMMLNAMMHSERSVYLVHGRESANSLLSMHCC